MVSARVIQAVVIAGNVSAQRLTASMVSAQISK